jgi:phosphate transport system substrate-binding protein
MARGHRTPEGTAVNLKRHGILAGTALTVTLALAACGSDNNSGNTTTTNPSSTGAAVACASGSLTAQGSTAQKNAMDQWTKDYSTKCSGASINYQPTGSSAGRTAFINGTADFGGSDSPLNATEQPQADSRCKTGPAIHLPTVVGPIAIAYNLSGVSDLQLKPATIAQIFAGKITKWDDPAIKADNSSASLPSTAILTVHRSDGSGTTDNFTNFLSQTAPSDWTFGHDSNWKATGGSGQKGSDGVGGQITKTAGAIGYVEWSYAQVNNLKLVKVGNNNGEFVALTAEAAGKTINDAKTSGSNGDIKLSIDYTTKQAGAYLPVLVSYEIVCSKGNDAGKLALLKGFLKFAMSSDEQSALASVGYGPMPANMVDKINSSIDSLS